LKKMKKTGVSVLITVLIIMIFLLPPTVCESFGGNSSAISGTETYRLQAILKSHHAQFDGDFGWSLASSSKFIVVGAPFESVRGVSNEGRVYIFNANNHTLMKTLTSPNAQYFGDFGWAIALSGKMLVVGAIYENSSGLNEPGRVYVYDVTTGSLIHALSSPNAQNHGDFGDAVATDGKLIVVGAGGENASGKSAAGRSYIFNAASGSLMRTLKSPSPQTIGDFGASVAICNQTVIVGAPVENQWRGHAYEFNVVSGSIIRTLTSPHSQYYGWFGVSIATNGKVIAVGADGEASEAGRVYIFNATSGVLIRRLSSPNSQSEGYFGYSVAITGRIIVVGAWGETSRGQLFAGNAYIFNIATGFVLKTLTSKNPQNNGVFGLSVTAAGNTVSVGAPNEIANGRLAGGIVYVY
jgi:hypothetical protein